MTTDIKEESLAEQLFSSLAPWDASSMDPTERFDFSHPFRLGIQRFDPRSDQQLREVISDHPLGLERERAAWEYADRHGSGALDILTKVAQNDSDASIRISALWALQKFCCEPGVEAIQWSLHDHNAEVRDWARLLIRETLGQEAGEVETRIFVYDESNPFDQTMPLLIAGYARMIVPSMGWVQATLSPQWFESIMGRVMACTRESTFDTDLVIEKRISKYHSDGTDHFEIYKFRGFTHHLTANICHHQYEAQTQHTFYPSGKVEDFSATPLRDVRASIGRAATTVRIGDPDKSHRKVVQSVRGRYMGAAFVNLERVLANGMTLGAGEVQLSTFHHPIVGPITNTFLFGSFKGKLSDLNDDGCLDVNTERCHGTINGELDRDLDGIADKDPYDPQFLVER